MKFIKTNRQKISFGKSFKRRAFIELSTGVKLETFLKKEGYNIDSLIEKDKKYALKLAHKWKKDFFEHREMLNFNFYELNSKNLIEEIKLLGTSEENAAEFNFY